MANLYTPQAIWGRELRHYRKAADLTQGQLAERIHFSESLISGVEDSVSSRPARSSPKHANKILSTDGALHRLLDWRKGQALPSWFGKWRDKEQDAITLRTYEPMVMPGLLQTEAYAHALLGDDAATAARLERQAILTREDPPPPILRCVIDELALHRLVGSPEIVREQLEHLVAVANSQVSVQVVPRGCVRTGILAGFAIATLEGGIEVAYLDTAIRGLTTSDQDDVTAAVAQFEAIRIEALPLSMSIDLIKRTAEERWT